MKRANIEWRIGAEDHEMIRAIVARAGKLTGMPVNRMTLEMDITACHLNGSPLRLADLLIADDLNFEHDVFGIHRHIDRDTGQLKDCFVPRYAVKCNGNLGLFHAVCPKHHPVVRP